MQGGIERETERDSLWPLHSFVLEVSHLAQLLHSDHAVSITIKEFEGLLQAVDVLPGELPVRAESLCVPGHGWAGSAGITGCVLTTTLPASRPTDLQRGTEELGVRKAPDTITHLLPSHQSIVG